MKKQTPDLSAVPQLRAFAAANPAFDILHGDLLDAAKVDRLNWASLDRDKVLPVLKAYQRLLRLDPDIATANALYDAGMDSARRITSLSRSQFRARFASILGSGGAATADHVYAAAVQAKSRANHLAAAVHGAVASRYSRALAGANVSNDVSEQFQALSSYQQMFGSLDYCECKECTSILGPPAFLVDLLRIIDLAITVPNKDTIPAGLTLNDRRPDIGSLELTCANTLDEVPYLELVNLITGATVSQALAAEGKLLDDDQWLTLANSYYPFNLPFNLPLNQIRAYIENRGSALYEVFSALSPSTAPTIESSRERLKLSPNQLANIQPQQSGNLPAVLSSNFGLTITAGNLGGLDHLDVFEKQTGLQTTEVTSLFLQNLSAKEIFDVSGKYTLSARGTEMTLTQTGDRVTGGYDQNGGVVDGTIRDGILLGHWLEDNGTNGNIQFTFAADGSGFTGKWSNGYGGAWEATAWNGTREASTPATGGIIPHSFFINKVLPVRTYLHVETMGTDPDTYAGIAGQSLDTLDTTNRFLRLSQILGWAYAELDWVLTSLNAPKVDDDGNLTNATSLDNPTIISLAKIKELEGELPTSLRES